MKNKGLRGIIIIILLLYIITYYVANSGYYEYTLHEKMVLTNEKIKEFESDIKDNNNIDIKEYLIKDDIDYTNRLSNRMYNISNKSMNITRKIIKYIFKKLSYLVED